MKFLTLIALLSASSFAHAMVTPEEKIRCATEAIQTVLRAENLIVQGSMQMTPTAMDKMIGRPLMQRGLGSMTEDHVTFSVKSTSGVNGVVATGNIILVSEIIPATYDPGVLSPNSVLMNINGEKVLCHLSTRELASGPGANEEIRLTLIDFRLQ